MGADWHHKLQLDSFIRLISGSMKFAKHQLWSLKWIESNNFYLFCSGFSSVNFFLTCLHLLLLTPPPLPPPAYSATWRKNPFPLTPLRLCFLYPCFFFLMTKRMHGDFLKRMTNLVVSGNMKESLLIVATNKKTLTFFFLCWVCEMQTYSINFFCLLVLFLKPIFDQSAQENTCSFITHFNY